MTTTPLPGHLSLRDVGAVAKPISGYIPELESLRGIAALIVVFEHFTRLWQGADHPAWLRFMDRFPLHILISGHASVTFFFVLSGFVLARRMLTGKHQPYGVYAVRRICRIYLPYLAAILLSVLLCSFFYGRQEYGHEFHLLWFAPPTFGLVAQHLLMLGKFDVLAYDPSCWSLVHEMRISLTFSAIVLVMQRCKGWLGFLFALAFPLMAALLELQIDGGLADRSTGASLLSWLDTLTFCGLFVLGGLLARHYQRAGTVFTRTTWLAAAALSGVLVALKLVGIAMPADIVIFEKGIGACLLILAALRVRSLSRVLNYRPLRFLGRISYSLYLLHMPILMLLAMVAWQRFSLGFMFLPLLAISFAVSALFYRWVKQPSIQLSRSIGKPGRGAWLARL